MKKLLSYSVSGSEIEEDALMNNMLALTYTLLAYAQLPRCETLVAEGHFTGEIDEDKFGEVNTFLVSFLETDESDNFSIRLTVREFLEELISKNRNYKAMLPKLLAEIFDAKVPENAQLEVNG